MLYGYSAPNSISAGALPQILLGSSVCSPYSISVFKVLTSKRREGKGREREGERRGGRE